MSANDTSTTAQATDDQFDDPKAAAERAEELGLDGIHWHPDEDGDGRVWMPGGSHDSYERAVEEASADTQATTEREAFAGYDSHAECVQANSDKDDPDAYCASIKRAVEGEGEVSRQAVLDGLADLGAIEQQAAIEEGQVVAWTDQGRTLYGRVDEIKPTASEDANGSAAVVIDQWDDRVNAFRQESVIESVDDIRDAQKDLPPRNAAHVISQEAWSNIVQPVHESKFTADELDYIATTEPDILEQLDPTTWALTDGSAVYEASIPARYDDIDLTPTEGMQENAQRVLDAREAEGNPNDCLTAVGWARARDLANGERLRPDTWREMNAFFARHDAQDADEADGREDRTDCSWMAWNAWGGDAGQSRSETVVDQLDRADEEAEMEMQGPVAAQRSIDEITEQDSNKVDLDSLTEDEREAVEADDFYLYGRASIEQWNKDGDVFIQMDALEDALDRFFESETAPGIISRHHQDIPVGVPVREFEFEEDATLDLGDDVHEFEAGDTARAEVRDADDDGQPELWLPANISNDNEMAKKTRVLAMRGDLDGFSVTIHRNEDQVTDEGTIVTEADLHAVTIGTADQIRNEGSTFDVASITSAARNVRDRVIEYVS